MMYSNVKLYFNSNILPNRNFEIESIDDYLYGLTKTTLTKFQYIKHQLAISIKVNMNQSNLNYVETNNIDYISIQNYTPEGSSEKEVFYFVINKIWKAEGTIQFDLYMDTINSFASDYTLSNRTKISREHKDRWLKTTSENETKSQSGQLEYDILSNTCHINVYIAFTTMTYANEYDVIAISCDDPDLANPNYSYNLNFDNSGTYPVLLGYIEVYDPDLEMEDYDGVDFSLTIKASNNSFSRLINEYSEGINPQLYKQLSYEIKGDEIKWNLVYRKISDSNNSVNCLLIPSIPIQAKIPASSSTMSGIFALAGTSNYFYISEKFGRSILFTLIDSDDLVADFNAYSYVSLGNKYYIDYSFKFSNNNQFEVYKWRLKYNSSGVLQSQTSLGKIKIASSTTFKDVYFDYSQTKYALLATNTYATSSTGTLTLSETTYNVNSIEQLNRLDPLLIKIIELPFCPIEYTITSEVYEFSSFIYLSSDNFIQLVEQSFLHEITTDVSNPLGVLRSTTIAPSIEDSRDDNNETKLLHSDYYLPKFVYDSFSYPFILEWQQNVENDTYLKFKFKTTNTINSRFLFDFYREHLKLDTNDYSSILVVDRNNEGLILNDDYITYLKNGYNYDKKYKQISQTSAVMGGIGSTIGGVATIAGGIATSNPALVIGGIASIASGVVSAVNSVAKSELSLQQKLQEKLNQAINVNGADDLDLLNYYTDGNKPKLVYYKVSTRMKNALANLFYYTGYATNEYGVPQRNTRTWFNFIQAEVDFASSKNLSEDILNDIKTRYQIGLTILHKVNGSWNFSQDKENWEVSIL